MQAVDPVCGMDVDTETAAAVRNVNGEAYYFCSEGCARQFDARPQDYMVGGGAQPAEPM